MMGAKKLVDDDSFFKTDVLDSIRKYNVKHRAKYGEMVICCDGPNSWRKSVFPYYKANRRKAKKASTINWERIYALVDQLKADLDEYFPYKVVEVEGAEGDDVIAALAIASPYNKPVLIISGDKDFIQLQNSFNVEQYDPIRKRVITHNNPEKYLQEHIFKGDMVDGIPNIRSKDDTYVIGQRSSPVRQKMIDHWMTPQGFEELESNEELKRNYMRNSQLIDLTKTPKTIQENIIQAFESQPDRDRTMLYNYFMDNDMELLMTDIGDF